MLRLGCDLQTLLNKGGFARTAVRSATKGSNQSRWLKRQQMDFYVKRAHKDNYRCRSAYKLIELDNKFQFLLPGKVVIDCGASPGSWTQVAVDRVLPHKSGHFLTGHQYGAVIAVDLLDIEDINGATIFSRCDFTSTTTHRRIFTVLPSSGADVIMSDMAPNASGNHSMNHEAILGLCESALDFSKSVLKPSGIFLCKLWDGYGTQDFINTLEKSFHQVQKCKPQASRKESAEIYLYAENFKK